MTIEELINITRTTSHYLVDESDINYGYVCAVDNDNNNKIIWIAENDPINNFWIIYESFGTPIIYLNKINIVSISKLKELFSKISYNKDSFKDIIFQ